MSRVPAVPPPPAAGYTWAPVPELTDEFDEAAVDETKWLRHHPYWTGRDSTFDPSNVYLSDGKLCLRTTARDANDIRAACLSSKTKQAVPGYYYEASIQTSRLSMTSSFWFQGDYSEIDVIEELGASLNNPWKNGFMFSNTHFFPHGWSADQATPRVAQLPSSCDAGFHTYGIWWQSLTEITLYHNNAKVQDITPAGNFGEPMYLFFDTEVFSAEGRPALDSLQDDTRNTMRLEWVRTWRQVPEPHQALEISNEPDGCLVSFSGRYDHTYSVWASSDQTHWSRLGRAKENPDGLFVYFDAEANGAARFYQVRTP